MAELPFQTRQRLGHHPSRFLADFNLLASRFGQGIAAGADERGDAASDRGGEAAMRKRLGELLD